MTLRITPTRPPFAARRRPQLRVIEARTDAELEMVYRLRHAIYIEEMGLLPADHPWVRGRRLVDPYDAYSTHLLLMEGQRPVGGLRLTWSDRGPLEISEAVSLAAHGGDDHVGVEVTRLMVRRSHRGRWATAPLFMAAWRRMATSRARYIWGAGKLGHLGRYYKNLGFQQMGSEAFRYPLVGTGEYELLRIDLGGRRSLRRMSRRVVNALGYMAVRLAPSMAALKYRRGLGRTGRRTRVLTAPQPTT